MHAQRFVWEYDPLKVVSYRLDPQKAHGGTTPFDLLSVKICAAVSALACRKNPQTKNEKKEAE